MRGQNKLTALGVARLTDPGRYGDGGGLHLQITSAGVKSWLFRDSISGRERWHGLGPVRDVSLAEARDAALACRQKLRSGIDPISQKWEQAAKSITFATCAEECVAAHETSWRNEKHRLQWRSTLSSYVLPTLQRVPVGVVSSEHMLTILRPIWHVKPETARRVRGRVEAVLDYATARGYRTGENPARWRGHLKHLLGQVQGRAQHHPAMPYKELPAFMALLKCQAGFGALALRLTILTAARTNEVIGAQCSEFSRDEALWIIPNSRMKHQRQHRVPLSPQAEAVLGSCGSIQGFLFPSISVAGHISNMAMAKTLRAMEHAHFTVHGFRSTFRDWAADQTAYPNHVVEMALAHTISDKVEAAYRRGDLFEKRKALMDDWGLFCDSGI